VWSLAVMFVSCVCVCDLFLFLQHLPMRGLVVCILRLAERLFSYLCRSAYFIAKFMCFACLQHLHICVSVVCILRRSKRSYMVPHVYIYIYVCVGVDRFHS